MRLVQSRGWVSLLAVTVVGCLGRPASGNDQPTNAAPDSGVAMVDPTNTCAQNDAMMKALAPQCASCHTTGLSPFFASLTVFEDKLAYDTRYVVPGHPEKSPLIALLNGAGTGTYKQMPLGAEPFAAMAARGETGVTVEQVAGWIQALEPRTEAAVLGGGGSTMSRLSADKVRRALYRQLGLTDDDFFTDTASFGVALRTARPRTFALRSPDDPMASVDSQIDERHAQLGGSQAFQGRTKDLSTPPPFVLALTGTTQRWCRMSVAKSPCPWMKHATRNQASTQASVAIKKNIQFMALHFWSQPISDDELTEVYDDVFVPLERETTPENAWIGVCSYFVRHPLWIFY